MNSGPTSKLFNHCRIALDVNSGPLSERIYLGNPRVINSSDKTSITSNEVNCLLTTVPKLSRVNSSIIVKTRKDRLSRVLSWTKSWSLHSDLWRTQSPLPSYNLDFLGCLAGTLSPSSLHIRATLLWLTLQPSCFSKAVIRLYPYRPYLLARLITQWRKCSSSSSCLGSYLCVARHWLRIRHARRSDTPWYSMVFSTISLRRAGLTSFPMQHPSKLHCPDSNRQPNVLTLYFLSPTP